MLKDDKFDLIQSLKVVQGPWGLNYALRTPVLRKQGLLQYSRGKDLLPPLGQMGMGGLLIGKSAWQEHCSLMKRQQLAHSELEGTKLGRNEPPLIILLPSHLHNTYHWPNSTKSQGALEPVNVIHRGQLPHI